MAPLDSAITRLRQNPPDVEAALQILLSLRKAQTAAEGAGDLVTVTETARRLQVDPARLRALIRSGAVSKPTHFLPTARKPTYTVAEVEQLRAEIEERRRKRPLARRPDLRPARRPVRPPEGYLTLVEVADRLGVRPATLRGHMRAGRIAPPTHVVSPWSGRGRLWTTAEAEAVMKTLRQWWKDYAVHLKTRFRPKPGSNGTPSPNIWSRTSPALAPAAPGLEQ